MSSKTPLGRARGLGSAKEGAAHWWAERLTAVALIPLTVWFAAGVAANAGADHATVVAWLRSPASAVLMALFVAISFYHGQLAIQVVLDDYVHREPVKIAALIAVKLLALLFAATGVFAVLRVALGG